MPHFPSEFTFVSWGRHASEIDRLSAACTDFLGADMLLSQLQLQRRLLESKEQLHYCYVKLGRSIKRHVLEVLIPLQKEKKKRNKNKNKNKLKN